MELSGMIASAAEKASRRRDGEEMGYSEASLVEVEHMLDEAAEYLSEMTPKQVTNLVQNVGCYILEVGRRAFGCC